MRRSLNDCQDQVKVFATEYFRNSDSGPYKHQWDMRRYGIYGIYTIQTGSTGGRDWYKSYDGQYAIWYDDQNNKWRVGSRKNRGSTKSVFWEISDEECPEDTGTDWKYKAASNDWVDAGYGMMVLWVSPYDNDRGIWD